VAYDLPVEKGTRDASAGAVAPSNEEAHEAWDGVLFDRWIKYRELVTTGLGVHGEAALRAHPPNPGDTVLDLGCGLGDTTVRLAGLVGPEGEAVGIDVSENMIETARKDAEGVGARVSFIVGDIQVTEFDRRFDYAFSRMGTMFFANPVAALRNVRNALVPGGRLCMVVWRRKLDNDWLHRAELVVEKYLEEPEESDEPTCGPGPFSMAGADTTSDILVNAGFEGIEFIRNDIEIQIGRDIDHAVEFAMSLGPAGELIRLVGEEEAARVRPEVEADLREAFADFAGPDGVRGPASTWTVAARVPAA
jgi:SAM-dependent methyltransferase